MRTSSHIARHAEEFDSDDTDEGSEGEEYTDEE
jgi:hypothetical protein